MNRRRVVYPVVAIALAAIVLISERWLNPPPPARKPPPKWVPPVLPGEPPPTIKAAPKPTDPPIGRPPDASPSPGAPAMQGTLQIEPVPVPAMGG